MPAMSMAASEAINRPTDRADRTRQSERIQAHVATSPTAPISSPAGFTSQNLLLEWGSSYQGTESTPDLQSGLLGVAYASAVNLADKIATFLSRWLDLGKDHVDDRNWAFEWVRRNKKTKEWMAGPVLPGLDRLMSTDAHRLTSLLGLIDMAQEEAESSPDARRRPIRNAAIHRFLSVRVFGMTAPSGYADAIDEGDLADALLDELRRVRRMFFQICWAAAEKALVDSTGKPTGELPLWPYGTEVDPID